MIVSSLCQLGDLHPAPFLVYHFTCHPAKRLASAAAFAAGLCKDAWYILMPSASYKMQSGGQATNQSDDPNAGGANSKKHGGVQTRTKSSYPI